MSAFSSIAFEPILRYAGFFWTKVTMALLTTGGAVLLAFYSENNDVIIWAWNLMGFPSVMYIIINTNEQAPRFPSISGLTIGRDTRKFISGQKIDIFSQKSSISQYYPLLRSCQWALRRISWNIFDFQIHV